ncbi:dormancy-associated protein homolog 3-like isoform X1 [Nymphaea colorata]|nr:dormancy-associated protein homolog 3-like isoform X1 [Nymphaea colorata]
MGLLDKLWDDTVAGPQPESGLGRLRKHPTFGGSRPAPEAPTIEEARVSRAITIIKTSNFRDLAVDPNSGPASPVGSDAPESPLSWTPRGDVKRFRRKFPTESFERAEPRSPTVYDWVVISALDR